MARYRWPEALGGGEHEEFVNTDGSSPAPHGTRAFLVAVDGSSINPSTDGGYVVYVAKDLLTEVEPPLPPEPPVGSVARVVDDGEVRFFERRHGDDTGWFDERTWVDWKWLCSFGSFGQPPVLLVPDPLAEAPELPLRIQTGQGRDEAIVEKDEEGIFRVGIIDGGNRRLTTRWTVPLTRDDVRAMGLALLKAAAS